MPSHPKKRPREKNPTARYKAGGMDEEHLDSVQRFTERSRNYQRDKTERTSVMRAEDVGGDFDIQSLPVAQIVQVHSLYFVAELGKKSWVCVLRKTLSKVNRRDLVVGDFVRVRDLNATDESGQPQAVIEQILPRTTLLTRADSFKQLESHPIVSNAEQMLIVTSAREPKVKWGLVDRMLIAARSGGLTPIICLNKIDLLPNASDDDVIRTINYYATLGYAALQTSVMQSVGLQQLHDMLKDRTTVLAGHSGVGKSSLISAVEPALDLRIGAISGYTGKGKHTTSSAQRHHLSFGGYVIDTPGVKLFGLWGVTQDNLLEHFPDVADGSAPEWRKESYERIVQSLAG